MKREDDRELAALTTDIRVRVLNCAATGCLVETHRPLDVGSGATLRITFSGGDFEDTVQVVRCLEITGAAVYPVWAEFLTRTLPAAGSLWYLMRRGNVTGWLQQRDW
jgi:hypothetical protein